MIQRYFSGMSLFSALILSLLLICANNTVSSGTADIELRLIWRSNDKDASSSEVDTLHITITSASPRLKDSVVTDINWKTKIGNIKGIPVGIPITILIDARNQFHETLFRGIDSIKFTSPVTQLKMVLSKLPPAAPSDLEFKVQTNNTVELTWHDTYIPHIQQADFMNYLL
jgi:hypothetical protein